MEMEVLLDKMQEAWENQDAFKMHNAFSSLLSSPTELPGGIAVVPVQ